MARGEIYAQVSCDYYDNAKMIAAGEAAELLYVRALCLANRLLLDGKISDEHLVALRFRDGRKRADALVRAGLWERTDGGWTIIGWAERNRSRLEIMDIRERERARKKAERIAAREARAAGRKTDTEPPDHDPSGKRPAGQPTESVGTEHGRAADVRADSASHRSSTIDQRSSTIDHRPSINAHRSSIIDQLPDDVDLGDTSQVLPPSGSGPRLRSVEPASLNGSIDAVLRGLA